MIKPLCPVPWDHVFLRPDGTFGLCCCSAPINKSKLTFEEHWNSDKMKSIRLQMINQTLPKECIGCSSLTQRNTQISYEFRSELSKDNYKFFDVQEDGTTTYTNPKTVDIRTIYCNFKCRMCGPTFSSSLAKIHNIPIVDTGINFRIRDEDLKDIIYFNLSGGESFMSPIVWDILYRLKDARLFESRLNIDTNLSYKNIDKIREILKDFKWVKFNASLDATGEIGEYLREGLDYDLFLKNLRFLKPIFNSATENYPIRKKQITIFFTGTSIGIQDLHNIVTLCLKENIRLLTRKVSCPQTNFLNINVCKIEYINKCIDDAMIKAKGTRLEKVITDFSNLVQKTYVPVKIDLSSLEQSEKLLGKEGYFLSLMKGNLN